MIFVQLSMCFTAGVMSISSRYERRMGHLFIVSWASVRLVGLITVSV